MSRYKAGGVGSDELFDPVLFGYKKEQVSAYVQADRDRVRKLAAEVQRLSTVERELVAARRDVDRLTTEVDHLTAELATMDPYGVVGPRVQQILRLAQEEAAAIRHAAAEELRQAQSQAHAIIEAENAQALAIRRDYEIALNERRMQQRAAADEVLKTARAQAAAILDQARSAATEAVDETGTEAGTENEADSETDNETQSPWVGRERQHRDDGPKAAGDGHGPEPSTMAAGRKHKPSSAANGPARRSG